MCWIPLLWIETIVYLVTFLPPMIALISMSSHHDDAKHRHKLYKTYLTFSVIIGVPLMIAAQLYIYYNIQYVAFEICTLINTSPNGSCVISASYTAGYIWVTTLFNAAIILSFRMYFVSVMKKYYEAGHHGERMMH